MIYITGDTHGDFQRFSKKHLAYPLSAEDYVIVCGDFGLLWAEDKQFQYNLEFFEQRPYKVLWVSGNHENYQMISQYPISIWNGGKVRHIIKDKVILLERGQVFEIEGKRFFTFGGASSHDIQGGVLDITDPDYLEKKRCADKSELPYRIKNISWWQEELPEPAEMLEGEKNLEKVQYKVDYVISHCASTYIQNKVEEHYCIRYGSLYQPDILTEYFEKLEGKLQYAHWFCGHYHTNLDIDFKHTILFEEMVPLNRYEGESIFGKKED